MFDVNNLYFSYYKCPMTVRGAKFSFTENQNVLILASKDMGKTTILKVLSGFDESYMGSIKLNGQELKSINDKEKNFSLLLESPIFFEKKSIRYNIDYLCEVLKIEKLTDDELNKLLKDFEIESNVKCKVSKLSLFEKRKLAIIRSVIKKSKIIFLDDQLVGLLDDEQNKMIEFYQKLCKENCSLVMAISDSSFKKYQNFIKSLPINKVLYLCDAELFEFSSVDEFEKSFIREDIFNFIKEFYKLLGFIFKIDGKYYFCEEDKREIELEKVFYQDLELLKLENGENERVDLFSNTEINLENMTDKEFNQKLKSKEYLIFSNLDGKKVF